MFARAGRQQLEGGSSGASRKNNKDEKKRKPNNKYGRNGTIKCRPCRRKKQGCIWTSGQGKCDRCQGSRSECGKPEYTERRSVKQNPPGNNTQVISNQPSLTTALSSPIHIQPQYLSLGHPAIQSQGFWPLDQQPQPPQPPQELAGPLALLARNVERDCPELNINEGYVEMGRRLADTFKQRLLAHQAAHYTVDSQGLYNNQRSEHLGELQVPETQHLLPSSVMRRTLSPTTRTTTPGHSVNYDRPRSAPAAQPQAPFIAHNPFNRYQAGTSNFPTTQHSGPGFTFISNLGPYSLPSDTLPPNFLEDRSARAAETDSNNLEFAEEPLAGEVSYELKPNFDELSGQPY